MRAVEPSRKQQQEGIVSALVAAHAERHSSHAFAEFKRDVLSGQLVKREGIHDWIQKQESNERAAGAVPTGTLRYRRYMCVTSRHDAYKKFTGKTSTTLDRRRVKPCRQPLSAETFENGRLERLRNMAKRLSWYYAWDALEAVTFALTGEPPSTPMIAGSIQVRPWFPARSRVILVIDPMCAPSTVAREYDCLRRAEFGALHPLDNKHLALAVFTTQRPMVDARGRKDPRVVSWLDEWNNQYPDWQYDKQQPSVFIRDCVKAEQRFLGLGNWGKRGGAKLPAVLRAEYDRQQRADEQREAEADLSGPRVISAEQEQKRLRHRRKAKRLATARHRNIRQVKS